MNRRAYERHAERYGAEGVLEQALTEGWPSEEYLYLVGRMIRVDAERAQRERAGNPRHYIEPGWRPTREQTRMLIEHTTSVDAKKVARLLGVTQQTVKRHRQAALEAAKNGQKRDSQGAGRPTESAA